MARRRPPAALLAVCALAAADLPPAYAASLEEPPLAADDECGAGGEACALSALQARGLRLEARSAAEHGETCAPAYGMCLRSGACCDKGYRCYMKDSQYAACLRSCTPGVHMEDPPLFQTPWSCREVQKGGSPAHGGGHRGGGSGSGKCAKRWSDNCLVTRRCCDSGYRCYEKNAEFAACRKSCTPDGNTGTCKLLPETGGAPSPGPAVGPSPTPGAPAGYQPANPKLLHGSNGKLLTFHVYRAQNKAKYPPLNVNAGNLAGIMWYMQNEIVSGDWGSTERFGISRIIRYKVQVKATQPLLDRGMNFGVRVAFDYGKCTGPTCTYDWDTFGYNVGCNNLGEYPYPKFDTHYPGGVWYSLPGSCPSQPFWARAGSCASSEPGGLCKGGRTPTGAGDCTWSYEEDGHIELKDLYLHKGKKAFWENKWWEAANAKRVEAARRLFEEEHGPELPAPPCDFGLDEFYKGYGWAESHALSAPPSGPAHGDLR